MHTRCRTHENTYTCTRTHTHRRTHSLTHKDAYTCTHTHTLTHCRTFTLSCDDCSPHHLPLITKSRSSSWPSLIYLIFNHNFYSYAQFIIFVLQDLNRKNTAGTQQEEREENAAKTSSLSCENNLDIKRGKNLTWDRSQENVDIVIPEMIDRIRKDEEGEEGIGVGRDKIEIERVDKGDEAEEDKEKNGDWKSKKERNKEYEKEEVSNKIEDNKDVVEENEKQSAHVSQRKEFTDLMKSKIQPRMKVFPSF